MVKDDSLYVIAIVAVVAVVGLVVMATSSSSVVVAEDLPSMVDSDSTAIAGQAIKSSGKIQRPPYATRLTDGEEINYKENVLSINDAPEEIVETDEADNIMQKYEPVIENFEYPDGEMKLTDSDGDSFDQWGDCIVC